ncbi:MAG TPA: outer membrane protein assembly factor BamA [Thermodesulfovibrionales bacterium]|nr:outer membrane protein assembly factor BamA [Thermodesulfovibrionales bacterium]
MVRLWAIALTYLIAAVIAASSVLAQEQLPVVNSIEVKGLKRVEEGALKSKITQKVGEPLSNEKVSEDIKNIFKMGYFDDVKTEIDPMEGGIKLIYVVKEKPTIIRVEFQGNKELEDDKLKEKISVTVGSIADTTLIQDNATKLQLFYEDEGYWLATVVPVVNKISENEVYLTFQIDEGKKVKVRDIRIVGNKAISSGKIKGVMKTGTWKIYSFIFSSGYYKKDVMNVDLDAIKDLYFNNGYIKVIVADPEILLTEDKSGMTITINISEGDQYRVSSVSLTAYKAFTEAELRGRISASPGAIFSKEVVRADITSITDLYTQNGYALASVYPDIMPDDATKQLSLTYKVEEGKIYRVGMIEITGNTKTKDKVIRREIRIDEGDIFNSALLKRSYERLNNLNYFETVDLVPKPKYEEQLLDVDVKVKEKSTGFLSVGGGYSSVDKFVAMVDITQANLFGTGRYLRARGELGGNISNFTLSYKDPWFMDKPVVFSVDGYLTRQQYPDYETKAIGGDFGFGKSFGEYWGANIMYNLSKVTVFGVSSTASTVIKSQQGTAITSSITPSITRDSRDSYIDPSSGSRNSVYFTFAGLGGDNKFVKGLADSAWFFPLGSTGTTIMVRGRIGYAKGIFNETLPLYENFCVGGIYTVRGIGYCQAGPKTDQGEYIGGPKELIFNTEYVFPIVRELKLKGVVFFDAGNAYAANEAYGTLRPTAGAGIRWISPMGPLRVEWGYNLNRRPGEISNKVEFTFGSFF